jgi:hypothetical protein
MNSQRPSEPLDIIAAAGLPPAVGAIVTLFHTELAGIEFPDLGRPVLDAAVMNLGEQLQAVEQARNLLLQRESELLSSKESLVRACERGLAYAQVFAAENEPLAATLRSISLVRGRGLTNVRERKPRVVRSISPEVRSDEPAGEQLQLERAETLAGSPA